jgi:HemK-like putative methylase
MSLSIDHHLPQSHYEYQLLARLVGSSTADVLMNPHKSIAQIGEQLFIEKLTELRSGVPLDYVVGWVEFAGKPFRIDKSTLIPREETEFMITQLQKQFEGQDNIFSKFLNDIQSKPHTIIDLGCGSGVIGLSLAKYTQHIIMTDISEAILSLTQKNGECLGITNTTYLTADTNLESYTQGVDKFWIVCNLPYVPEEDEIKAQDLNIDQEAKSAIFGGGENGLNIFQSYIHKIHGFKSYPQVMIFELDPRNIQQAARIVQECFGGVFQTHILNDQQGRQRYLVCLLTTPERIGYT